MVAVFRLKNWNNGSCRLCMVMQVMSPNLFAHFKRFSRFTFSVPGFSKIVCSRYLMSPDYTVLISSANVFHTVLIVNCTLWSVILNGLLLRPLDSLLQPLIYTKKLINWYVLGMTACQSNTALMSNLSYSSFIQSHSF
jgi:hypothetical protein